MSADNAAKINVSSLVSSCRNVSLNVACAKITVKSRKMQTDSAMSPGVLLCFFGCRFCEVDGNIAFEADERDRPTGTTRVDSGVGAWLHYSFVSDFPNAHNAFVSAGTKIPKFSPNCGAAACDYAARTPAGPGRCRFLPTSQMISATTRTTGINGNKNRAVSTSAPDCELTFP